MFCAYRSRTRSAVAGGRGDGQAWTIMGADAGLVVSSVPWATADREGLIWIAMRGGGHRLLAWRGRMAELDNA